MISSDRDKLIAAVYSASMSPEYYDQSLETIDTLVFKNLKKGMADISVSSSETPVSKNGKNKHHIDPEILHHIQRSNDINDRVGRQRQKKSRAELLLDTAPNPAFIFDCSENIVAMNNLAKINNGDTPCQKLAQCCSNTYVLEQIRNFVVNSKNQKLLVEPGYINAEQNTNTCVLVRKIDGDIKLSEEQQNGHSRNLYFFTMINLGFDTSKTELFKKTYGLTQAEVEVAVHLAAGLQIPKIALDRGAKVETIRTQIKAIKRKTHTRDVPSIVRLVCGFSAGILTSSHLSLNRGTTTETTTLKTHQHIILRDGRTLHYLEQGDPDGTPVLMLHTIPYGVELMQEASETAKRMNLRIISPYRPGYGQSDPYNAHGDTLLDSVAADIYELLVKLDIAKIPIVGVAIGSTYAMRFARLYPNRVSNLFAISRAPMWRDNWIAKTAKRQRFILRLARYTPQLLPLVTRATTAYIDKGHAKSLFKTVCADSGADMLALQNPEISDLMEKEFIEGLRQGCDALRRDIFLSVTDFSQEALRLEHRFHILHGQDDKVINIAQSKAFADFVSGTELEIVKDAGHLMIYSHWERILRAVKRKEK